MVRIQHFSRENNDDIFLILGQVKFSRVLFKRYLAPPPHTHKNFPVCVCEFWPYIENSLTYNNILLGKKSIFLANKSGFLSFKNEFFIFFYENSKSTMCLFLGHSEWGRFLKQRYASCHHRSSSGILNTSIFWFRFRKTNAPPPNDINYFDKKRNQTKLFYQQFLA